MNHIPPQFEEPSLHVARNGATSARILVADHGVGVPSELLHRLFEPFYRVSQGQEHETGGTGLGLSIAQRIATVHGGRIQAHNREGGGLEVEIVFPAASSTIEAGQLALN